jgi:hypothetical protein
MPQLEIGHIRLFIYGEHAYLVKSDTKVVICDEKMSRRPECGALEWLA